MLAYPWCCCTGPVSQRPGRPHERRSCLCPLVSDFQEPLSASYCFCSAGWLKEVYETVSGEQATVEILETVKRGGQRCRFNVTLNATES